MWAIVDVRLFIMHPFLIPVDGCLCITLTWNPRVHRGWGILELAFKPMFEGGPSSKLYAKQSTRELGKLSNYGLLRSLIHVLVRTTHVHSESRATQDEVWNQIKFTQTPCKKNCSALRNGLNRVDVWEFLLEPCLCHTHLFVQPPNLSWVASPPSKSFSTTNWTNPSAYVVIFVFHSLINKCRECVAWKIFFVVTFGAFPLVENRRPRS